MIAYSKHSLAPHRWFAAAIRRLFDPELILAPHRGWILWGTFALVVAIVQFHDPPTPGNVPQIYRSAALRWIAGDALYDGSGGGFIYPPQAAILFLPIASLPFVWFAAVWRILNVACFALGTRQLAGLAGGGNSARHFTMATLITLPLSWSAARYGQMTLLMGGLMIFSVACLYRRDWWLASVSLISAAVLKPLALPLVLLVAALFPRTSWRLILCGVAFLLLPFMTQTPMYVAGQYGAAVQMLRDANGHGFQIPYPQFFWSLRWMGWTISPSTQTWIQLGAAVGTFVLCATAIWRHKRSRALTYLLTFSVCYILLMNPRTENNTYALMAPALACFAAIALERRAVASIGLLFTLIACYTAGQTIEDLFAAGTQVWLRPLICLVFVMYVATEAVWTRTNKAQHPSSTAGPPTDVDCESGRSAHLNARQAA